MNANRVVNFQTLGWAATALLFAALALTPLFAQTRENDGAAPAVFTRSVEHLHGIGAGKGELRITAAGIEFQPTNPREARDRRVWVDEDIKRLEITRTQVRVVAYEAGTVPILPGRIFGRTRSIPRGSERAFTFHLLEGEMTPEIVALLLKRFPRPIATSVFPPTAENETSLFEVPVFHRHRTGGVSGTLRVFPKHLIFQANDNGDDSRYWRYSDLRDIARLGDLGLEIATSESQTATDGRSYVLDLKRPLTEAEYDRLWVRFHEVREK
jgi:hypothetical protein